MKTRDPLAISRRSAAVIHAMFLFYAIACIVPILLVFAISFSDETTIVANGYKLIPEKFSLQAYEYLFKDMDQIIHSYGISIIVTVIGTVTSVALTALYAYPLSRRDLPYRGWFAFFIFFTMLFNGGLVPWYLVYVNVLDLKNSILALILPLLMSPFFVLVMRTFSRIPFRRPSWNRHGSTALERSGRSRKSCFRSRCPFWQRSPCSAH